MVGTDYPLLQNTTFEKTNSLENTNFLLLTSTTGLKKPDLIEEIYTSAIEMKLPLVCSNPDILAFLEKIFIPQQETLQFSTKKWDGKHL